MIVRAHIRYGSRGQMTGKWVIPPIVLFAKHEEGESGGKSGFMDDEDDCDDGRIKNVKGEESDEEDEEQTGKCFVTTAPKSPLIAKEHDHFVSLNIPLNSYHDISFDFDETCSYLNDMLISTSNEAEKSKALLYKARNKLEEKNSKLELAISE